MIDFNLKKILNNKIFLFLINRYFVFIIQFFNFLFISIKLGVFNFGIYSFILLFLQYSNYSSLGTEYSLNVILSTKKRSERFNSTIFSNGLKILFFVSFLILLISSIIFLCDVQVFTKYSFNKYLIPTILIAIFWNFNNYYSNIYRVYGKLFEIAFFQTLIQIVLIPAIFVFKSDQLLVYLIYFTLIGQLVSLVLFIIKSPLNFKFRFNKILTKVILRRGLFLLFYNLSAVLILLSSKTIVSIFYSVKDMGQFSFANSISQTAVMGFSVISFILFPTLIEKFNSNGKQNFLVFERAKTTYFYAAYFTILFVVLVLPFLLKFFQQYEEAYRAIVFMLIAQIIASTSYAHSILLISNKKELQLGFVAIFSVFFNILFGIIVVYVFDAGYELIAFGNILTAIVYALLTIKKTNDYFSLNDSIPTKSFKSQIIVFIPLVIVLINSFVYNNSLINLIALILLLILNKEKIKLMFIEAQHILTDFRL